MLGQHTEISKVSYTSKPGSQGFWAAAMVQGSKMWPDGLVELVGLGS